MPETAESFPVGKLYRPNNFKNTEIKSKDVGFQLFIGQRKFESQNVVGIIYVFKLMIFEVPLNLRPATDVQFYLLGHLESTVQTKLTV